MRKTCAWPGLPYLIICKNRTLSRPRWLLRASIDKAAGRSKDRATTGIWAIGEALAEMTETEYLHRHALDQSITRGGPEMRAWVRSGEAGRLLKIWHTHEQVSTTYRQVSYSRPYPHVAQEMTDQELAEAVPDGAAMILMIPPDTWRRLTARYDLAGFYRAAVDGSSALRSWMDDRGLAYVDPSPMDDRGLADTLAENVYPWQEHMSEEEDRHRAWLESIPEEDRHRHDYEVGCARRLLRARHKHNYDRIQEAHPWMGVDTKIEAETGHGGGARTVDGGAGRKRVMVPCGASSMRRSLMMCWRTALPGIPPGAWST